MKGMKRMKLIKFKDWENQKESRDIWINVDLIHSIYESCLPNKGTKTIINYGMNYLEAVYLKENLEDVIKYIEGVLKG